MNRTNNKIEFTKAQLHGVPGRWLLEKHVNGKRIKVVLTDSKLSSYKLARLEARRIVMMAREGDTIEVDDMKTRKGIATIGEVLGIYTTTTRLGHVSAGTRKNNCRRLRMVIREGMEQKGAPLPPRRKVNGQMIYPEDKLSTEILTWELADAFKQYRLANAVPRTGVADPRRACDEPIPGKLGGSDLQRMMRTANSHLTAAQNVFSKASLLVSSGAYAGLNLADVSSFVAEPEFVANKAEQYIPPSVEEVERITDGMDHLRAGTLTNMEEVEPCGTGQRDKRLMEPTGFVMVLAGRRRKIDQSRCWIAMALAIELGLRLEEIVEARWSQFIELDGGRIFNCTSTATYRGTKSRVDRAVPVPDDLFAVISTMRTDAEFVVGASAWYRKNVLGREVASVMRFLGWRRPECIHELRKIFASDYGREVKNPIAVKDVLGHKSLKTTNRYLAHAQIPSKKKSSRIGLAA